MMEEMGLSEDVPRVVVSVDMELYLRHREDPLRLIGTFRFAREHLTETDNKLENFMTIVTNTFAGALDDKKVTRLVLSDEKFNKFLIQTEDIISVTVMAPTMEKLDKVLEDDE